MRCPRCNTQLAPDAAVCDVCQELVDPALLGAEPEALWERPAAPSRRAEAPPAARRQRPPTGTRPPLPPVPPAAAPPSSFAAPASFTPPPAGRTRPPTGAARPAAPAFDAASAFSGAPVTAPPGSPQLTGPVAVPEGEGAVATRIVQLDPEGDRNTRIVDVSVPAMVRRAARERSDGARGSSAAGAGEEQAPPTLIEDLLLGLRHFYLRMHRLDRWTAWVLGCCFVAAFLPWRRVQGVGLVSGIEGFGGISAVAAALAFTVLYLRTERRRLAGLMISLQVLAVVGVAGAPLYLMLGTAGVRFAFGFYATMLAAGIALLLTLARLTRINA